MSRASYCGAFVIEFASSIAVDAWTSLLDATPRARTAAAPAIVVVVVVVVIKLVDEVSLLISKDFDLGVCCHELACGVAGLGAETSLPHYDSILAVSAYRPWGLRGNQSLCYYLVTSERIEDLRLELVLHSSRAYVAFPCGIMERGIAIGRNPWRLFL